MNALVNRRLTQDCFRAMDAQLARLRNELPARTADSLTRIRGAHRAVSDVDAGWYLDAVGVGHGVTNGRIALEKAPQPSIPRTVGEEEARS